MAEGTGQDQHGGAETRGGMVGDRAQLRCAWAMDDETTNTSGHRRIAVCVCGLVLHRTCRPSAGVRPVTNQATPGHPLMTHGMPVRRSVPPCLRVDPVPCPPS